MIPAAGQSFDAKSVVDLRFIKHGRPFVCRRVLERQRGIIVDAIDAAGHERKFPAADWLFKEAGR